MKFCKTWDDLSELEKLRRFETAMISHDTAIFRVKVVEWLPKVGYCALPDCRKKFVPMTKHQKYCSLRHCNLAAQRAHRMRARLKKKRGIA